MYEALKVGTVYEVEFEDCCVEALFTSRLITKTEAATKDEYPVLWFENGVRVQMGGQYTEVPG